MADNAVKFYGVKEQAQPKDDLDLALEQLGLLGFAIVDSELTPAEQAEIGDAFARAEAAQAEAHGGAARLAEIDEHNTIRAPLLLDEAFLKLAQNPRILDLAARVFRGSAASGAFILNQQNGIINPPKAPYN